MESSNFPVESNEKDAYKEYAEKMQAVEVLLAKGEISRTQRDQIQQELWREWTNMIKTEITRETQEKTPSETFS